MRRNPPLLVCYGLLATGACAQTGAIAPTPDAPGLSAPGAPGANNLETLYERRELCGFPLMVSRAFEAEDPALLERVLLQLGADLDEVAHIVPGPALEALRSTTIWVELQGATVEGGMSGRGMCCHWSADWLESAGLPREKAGGVEIVNAADFLEWRRTQPYMTLHELAHAYHRMLGPETPEIVEAYEHARDAGLYREVGRNSIAVGEKAEAYAITNHHEYFAELSEAYFAINDFEPYTRPQLQALDPQGFSMVHTLWNLSAEEIADRTSAAAAEATP